jgi:Cu(I)/Ag(I) efflux system membrane fusion protein
VSPGAPWIEAEIADQDASKVQPGQEVLLSIPAYPGRSFKAILEEVAPHAQLKPDIAIRTRIVRVRIRPFEGLDKLRPGLEVDVFGESVAAQDALWIPSDALILLESETAVFVLEGGVARKREVETGFVGPERVEIVSGLAEGERVATSGKDLLTDGSRVRIEGAGRASGR